METGNLSNTGKLRERLERYGIVLQSPQLPNCVATIPMSDLQDNHVSEDDLSYSLAMCSMYGEVNRDRATISIREM